MKRAARMVPSTVWTVQTAMCSSKNRRGDPPRSGGGRKRRLLLLILIAIFLLKQATPADVDPLNSSLLRREVEGPARSYRYTSLVASRFDSLLDHCTHQIASAEAFDQGSLLRTRPREPVFGHQAHLPALPAGRLDQPGAHTLKAEAFWGRGLHQRRVDPVCFRQVPTGS